MKINELIERDGVMEAVTREMTQDEESEFLSMISENTEQRISVLKQKLFDTDYKAIKYAEGMIPVDEYESIREQRQSWRDEINNLESRKDV